MLQDLPHEDHVLVKPELVNLDPLSSAQVQVTRLIASVNRTGLPANHPVWVAWGPARLLGTECARTAWW